MLEIFSTPIDGCYEVQPKNLDDARGRFSKIYHKTAFFNLGLEFDYQEEYYSLSRKGVLRGMHFQVPPFDHVKLAYCLQGVVLDVFTDLRVGSPTYGKSHSLFLDSNKGNGVYLPKGMAHGFYSISENSIMLYKVGTMYSPDHDLGILWSSIGINWPLLQEGAILSDRDAAFPKLSEFDSPFKY